MNPLQLNAKHIEQIAERDHVDIIRLFKRFVYLECRANGLEIVDSYFSEKTTTPDGGEDGFLKLTSSLNPKFKSKINCFQFKASNFTAASCANEIIHNNDLKPRVREALEQDGTYYQIISKEFGARSSCSDREDAILKKAQQFLPSVKPQQIVVLDAEKLAEWFNNFLELIVRGYELLGISIPQSFQSISSLATEMRVDELSYYSNKKINIFRGEIIDFIGGKGKILRILGQPGIGKTRLIAESISGLEIIPNNVIYCKITGEGNDVLQFIRTYYLELNPVVFVFDDCSSEFLGKVSKYFSHPSSKISLIAIDHDVQEYYDIKTRPNLPYIFLDPDDVKDVVSNIINSKYKGFLSEPQIQVLVEYADGNPAMACMIAEEVDLSNPGAFYGRIDEDFKKRLLLGRQNHSDLDRLYNVAQACSIFAYFGFPQIRLESILSDEEKELIESQIKVLAENICSPPVQVAEFQAEVKFLIKRGLVQIYGKYHFIRPIPLAINLAIDYFNSITSTQVMLELVRLIQDCMLTDAFCDRYKYLGNSTNAKLIAEQIFGENSPFGKAEVLNTELGSRLFRSLVEVNPEALLQTLVKLFVNIPISQLRRFKAGRRNLIGSLEKLCFNQTTFAESATILYRFAQAENEPWGNNAQGIFKQLFRPFLSGTEADLNSRIRVLEYAVSQPFVEENEFLIDAIMSAFEIQGVVRLSGAEKQGTKVLKDYRPGKEETIEYWGKIIEILKKLWMDNEAYRIKIEKIFYLKSLQIISVTDPDLVFNFVNWLKSQGAEIPTHFFNTLKVQLKSKRITEASHTKICDFLNSNEPESPAEKFIRLVRDAIYSPGKDANGMDIDNTEVAVRELANDFHSKDINIIKMLDLMVSDQQWYTEVFIEELLKTVNQNELKEVLWNLTVKKLRHIPPGKRNWAVLNGILKNLPAALKIQYLLPIGDSEGFENMFINMVNLHLKTEQELSKVWDVLIRRNYPEDLLYNLRFGFFTYNQRFEPAHFICNKLKSLGASGYWSALDLLYRRILIANKTTDIEWKYFKELFLEFDFFKLDTKPKFIEFHALVELSKGLLKKFPEQVLFNELTERVLRFLATPDALRYDEYLRELTDEMITNDFDLFWEKLSKSLEKPGYLVINSKHLFGSVHNNMNGERSGILFEQPSKWKSLLDWCREDPAKRLVKMAHIMPIFHKENFDWHPFAKQMIDEFGNDRDFLIEMSANMGSFGWIGSPIDYHEREINLYRQLQSHELLEVKNFANEQIRIIERMIEREKLEDEERKLGL